MTRTQIPDRDFLRLRTRPEYEVGTDAFRVVDLFCGCGGLTLGLAEAARRNALRLEVPLAVDSDKLAVEVYRANFPKAEVSPSLVESWFDGELGAPLTEVEDEVTQTAGTVHCLAGGPPCQGHSDLNNHTRRDDPRNDLYSRMARAAEVLNPRTVMIENVPAVRHDKGGVVDLVVRQLEELDYIVGTSVLKLNSLGVPQKRKRHILLAVKDCDLDPQEVLDELAKKALNLRRTVRWAIEDLVDIEGDGFDDASTPTDENQARMDWLFDNDQYDLPNDERPDCHRDGEHSYTAMYGRLEWDERAPTITTGFGSMGQGRYVHPSRRRTITPHEAARLQFFPDFFDFSSTSRRGAWARLIGNAVPMKLSLVLGTALIEAGVVID